MDGALQNDRALPKIAALLVALAIIAERAAGRSFPVRFIVLCFLQRAEAVARAFVADETGLDWSWFDDAPETGWHPAEAARLALRFRLLAAALDMVCAALGADGFNSHADDTTPPRRARHRSPQPPVPVAWPPLAHDTS